jgi:hypothetical protein
LLGWDNNKKTWIGQVEFLDKAAYSHQLPAIHRGATRQPPKQMEVIPDC